MDGGNASKMVYDDVLSTVFKYQFPDQTGNKVIFEVTLFTVHANHTDVRIGICRECIET